VKSPWTTARNGFLPMESRVASELPAPVMAVIGDAVRAGGKPAGTGYGSMLRAVIGLFFFTAYE
jgi:hypothetical protein